MNEIMVNEENIKSKIYTVRGLQVMLDSDLAELYGVETKVFNQAVKRNIERFPENFRFQLTDAEYKILRSQFVTLRLDSENEWGKHTKYLPYVFTEQGVSMLSAVLKSKIAVQVSIQIIEAFVNMRKFISNNALIFQRLETLENKQSKNDEKFNKLFEALEDKTIKPKQGIFYDGEVFDAYRFVADLIRSAKNKIILIDNYVDDSVLTLFSKNQNIDVMIYTQTISKQLTLDLEKYNAQYKAIEIKSFKYSHDRFMIIDDVNIYHIGASLKDLGKKWFAFSKLDIESFGVLKKLEK
ncbi:MAG: ORF6N domain-containing protein [Arcobacteraceae bacterium]|nr:ORF6N domain-containing protein [Arcobacteraceae bacterium]